MKTNTFFITALLAIGLSSAAFAQTSPSTPGTPPPDKATMPAATPGTPSTTPDATPAPSTTPDGSTATPSSATYGTEATPSPTTPPSRRAAKIKSTTSGTKEKAKDKPVD